MRATEMSLEQQLERSVHQARAKRIEREQSDLAEWLAAIPEPESKKMTNAIELAEQRPATLVVHRDVSAPLEFTPQQQQMIRDTFANGANEKEFQVLMEIAKVRRLNPLLRQVHFVKRWDSIRSKDIWSVQVSVDGLRAIAERTGKYDGQDEPEYMLDKEGLIIACKVRVYRKDWSRPAVGVAYWSEYVQTKKDGSPTKFWQDMPHVMIAKCAEAIAMRKAFPEDMGGLYVDEEMQQADNDRPHGSHISPAILPNEAPDAPPADGGALEVELSKKLVAIKKDIASCDSYDKALALRSLLGTRAQQSELTKRLQAGVESGDISPTARIGLNKLWMHCDRQVTKLEKQLATGPEDALLGAEDRDEAALDAFSPRAESEDS